MDTDKEYELLEYELHKEKMHLYTKGVRDTVEAIKIMIKEDGISDSILQRNIPMLTYLESLCIAGVMCRGQLIGPDKGSDDPRQVFVQWKKDRRIQWGKIKKINKKKVINRSKN